MFFSWSLPLEDKNILGFFSQWYAKECIFQIQDCKPLGTGRVFSQDYIGIRYCGMEGSTASFMIRIYWTIGQVSSFFFTGRIGMLHSELVGTNSPQARNLFIRGCSPSRASLLRRYCFQFGNWVGSQRTVTTSSASWAHPGVPWSNAWGLILSSHSFWSLPIGEGVMDS